MDVDCIDIQRDRVLSRREKRWSMNSQRLEEIVAELMKPISDVRHSFDTDLSALLEEYLTEAGLHALEASERDGDDEDDLPLAPAAPPNFAELALLLQHSASLYGRKVDFLYQHVLSVSDSLQNSTHELERSTAEDESAGAGEERRRKRRASAAQGFEPLELAACATALRELGAPRPPPTLPRVYIELEPRQLAPADRPLTDYDHEPIGLLADFHVSWRLQDGMLVDELEGWGGGAGSLRPIPLLELQAAIQAAAPPALPALPDAPSRGASPAPGGPRDASTPLPPDSPHPPHPPHPPPDPPHPPEPGLLVKKERKRRCDFSTDDLVGGCFKILLNKKLYCKLRKLEEFSLDSTWIAGVVSTRRDYIRKCRLNHTDKLLADGDFRGFDVSDLDVGGFAGWSSKEAADATECVGAAAASSPGAGVGVSESAGAAVDGDSDDDGFFEQSSLGDSDASRVDDASLTTAGAGGGGGGGGEAEAGAWAAWQAGVVARAAAGEARGLDVTELAARVLAHLPPAPGDMAAAPAAPAVPCGRLLQEAARDRTDVPGLFLATLFLANAGNVEVIPGAPLSLGAFSLRLVSADPRRLAAAASQDPHFLR